MARRTEAETGPASTDGRPLVGITAPRDLSGNWRPLIAAVVRSVERAEPPRRLAVGDCPTGGDAYATAAAAEPPRIFRVSGASGADFAQRSAEMVREVWASARLGKGSGLIAFPHDPCPAAILASSDSRIAFPGAGNGTWSTIALAAGLCAEGAETAIPILAFWCAEGAPRLAQHWPGMRWEAVGGKSVFATAWRLIIDYDALPRPETAQESLWGPEVDRTLGHAHPRRGDSEEQRRRR